MYPYVAFQTHYIVTKCPAYSMLAVNVVHGLALRYTPIKYLVHYFKHLGHYFDTKFRNFACGKKIEHMRRAILAM